MTTPAIQHVVVIYAEADPDDNGRWVRSVHGPFPTREEAFRESQRAAHYGADVDVTALIPPFEVLQQQAAQTLANT